jgi:hypothetical protein
MIVHRLEITKHHPNDTIRCKTLTLDTAMDYIDGIVDLIGSWSYHIIDVFVFNVLSNVIQLLFSDRDHTIVMMFIITIFDTIADPISSGESTDRVSSVETGH